MCHFLHSYFMQAERDPALTGEVYLRFAATPQPGRLYWPSVPRMDDQPRALCLVLSESKEAGGELGRLLCRAGAVVLAIHPGYAGGTESSEPLHERALRWAADHAGELGADSSRLLLVGAGAAGGSAAKLALRARDLDWPSVAGQLLIEPTFSHRVPARVAGAAPATILSAEEGDDDGRRYAAALRAADVAVDEILLAAPSHELPPDEDVFAAAVRALKVAQSNPRPACVPPKRHGTNGRR